MIVLVQSPFHTTWASLLEMDLEPNSLDWNWNELEHELELEDMKRTRVSIKVKTTLHKHSENPISLFITHYLTKAKYLLNFCHLTTYFYFVVILAWVVDSSRDCKTSSFLCLFCCLAQKEIRAIALLLLGLLIFCNMQKKLLLF